MDATPLLLLVQAASIPEAPPVYRLTLAQVFVFLFIMLGPLKVIGPFAAATRELAPAALRALAVKVFALSVFAVVLGGLLGKGLLAKWQVSTPVLELAAGLIFALVSLQGVLAQYHEPSAATEPAGTPRAMHLVFPVNVTPYGIAAVILLLALSADSARMVAILAMAVAMLAFNLLAMLAARVIVHWAGLPLQILGAVLGVMQVALGLSVMISGLAGIGVDVTPGGTGG
jgi:multiple antibiotic resistance protein